jgi:hypothetical protein
MQHMQAPERYSAVDRTRMHPQLDQLPAHHDAVLTLREQGDRRVDATP